MYNLEEHIKHVYSQKTQETCIILSRKLRKYV